MNIIIKYKHSYMFIIKKNATLYYIFKKMIGVNIL